MLPTLGKSPGPKVQLDWTCVSVGVWGVEGLLGMMAVLLDHSLLM